MDENQEQLNQGRVQLVDLEKEMKKALERKSRRAAPGEEASPSRESPRSPVKYNVSPPGTGTA